MKFPAELRVTPAFRLLVSLSAEEREAFFPGHSLESSLPASVQVRWSEAKTAATWAQEIHEWKPDIIAGAWSTRPLPVPPDGALPARYYCHFAGAVRGVVARELMVRGLVVTNWGNSMSRFVAEAALMLSLAGLRQLAHHQTTLLAGGGWRGTNHTGSSLFQKRIGLHGFGAIAQEFVRLVAPFQVRLKSFDPFADPQAMARCGVERTGSLEELFAESDVLVELCALTEQTRGSVNGALLDRLPPQALIVNVARGQLIDEAALVERLRSGRIRAALDVFCREPLAADSPLREIPGITLTPHVAGNTRDSRAASAGFGLTNLHRFIRGESLEAQITLAQYDRMT